MDKTDTSDNDTSDHWKDFSMKNSLKITVILCLFAAFGLGAGSTASLFAGEKKSLFNGKDLSGWTTYIRDRGTGVDPNALRY